KHEGPLFSFAILSAEPDADVPGNVFTELAADEEPLADLAAMPDLDADRRDVGGGLGGADLHERAGRDFPVRINGDPPGGAVHHQAMHATLREGRMEVHLGRVPPAAAAGPPLVAAEGQEFAVLGRLQGPGG